jgi:hypothetical protein
MPVTSLSATRFPNTHPLSLSRILMEACRRFIHFRDEKSNVSLSQCDFYNSQSSTIRCCGFVRTAPRQRFAGWANLFLFQQKFAPYRAGL